MVWKAALDGAVQASPLVVGGLVIAATENNTLYAINRQNGRTVWARHLATPVRSASLPCGNIDPLGITGTPIYDAATGRVFAVTTARVQSGVQHRLWGLDVRTGATRVNVAVDPGGQDPTVENQRGALALSKGRVLIPFGGHAGDCGNYHGWLMSVTTSGQTLRGYQTGAQGEAGMWQPSGVSVDSSGRAFVVTGNGRATSGAWDGGNAVHVVDPTSMKRLDFFAPADWAAGNQSDSDLGSSGALLFAGRLWIQGKDGAGYLLDPRHLGGVGHPLQTVNGACAQQFGGAAAHGRVVFAPCTDGLRQVVLGSDGRLRAGWRAPSVVTGSPVVGGGAVWALAPSAGTLYELAEGTGRILHTVGVGPTVRFATPALSAGLLVIPTKAGLTAVVGA